jgi:hypothetical protein
MYRLNDVSTVSVTEIGGRGLAEVLLALVRGRRSLLELTLKTATVLMSASALLQLAEVPGLVQRA